MSFLAPLHDINSTWNGKYIVILKDEKDDPLFTKARLEAHRRWISEVVSTQDQQKGYFIEFSLNDIRMYYGKFPDDTLHQIRSCMEVKYVQKDGPLPSTSTK